MFYFLKDGERLKKWMLEYIPLKKSYTEEIIRETGAMMASVLRGTIVVAVVQGVVAWAPAFGFSASPTRRSGGLTVIVSIVPVVGTWLVVVPAVAYLFLTGQTAAAIGFAIWGIVLVNACYNLIAPQLMQRGVDIHPFIILLSVLGGIGAFGPIGLLVGPFIVAFLFALLRIYPRMVE